MHSYKFHFLIKVTAQTLLCSHIMLVMAYTFASICVSSISFGELRTEKPRNIFKHTCHAFVKIKYMLLYSNVLKETLLVLLNL